VIFYALFGPAKAVPLLQSCTLQKIGKLRSVCIVTKKHFLSVSRRARIMAAADFDFKKLKDE
jgi:hypothetical protein